MNDSRLPYPGLRAFDRDEADLFFGRDGAVDDMIDRLAETRFLAVLGSSGSGKSSLVKTGMLDGLELGLHPAGSSWKICEFTPGGRLFGNLAAALYDIQMESVGSMPDAADRDHGIAVLEGFLRLGPRSLIQWTQDGYLPASGNLLLLVDQFEELFRYGGYSEREEAEAFVKLLIESTSDKDSAIHCVITMRSDFLGACSLIPGLAEIINAGAYLTPRMSRNDCREAILGPARIVGIEIEEGLVNHLLNELVRFAPWEGEDDADQVRQLARRADQLPVMQHLLNRLWQHARHRAGDATIKLTLDDYAALGGLNGALDTHGEELLATLDADDQVLTEHIFRALVKGESPETATRRPLRFRDIVDCTAADDGRVRRVLDVFRADDCNFLRPGTAVTLQADTVVDISHESLIRQWTKLSHWVTEEARSANLWRRLSTAADRYSRGVGDLLTGLDLANLSTWWNEEAPQANWTARYSDNFDDVEKFIQKSVDAQRQRERDKAERDLRDRRRLQVGLASVSALAIVASVLAFWAIGAEDRANDANVAAFSIVQNMTDDLFSAIDDGLTTPITERHALIDERSGEIVDIAERLDDSDQATLMNIRWLTLTGNTLLDAGWVREAQERSMRLEALLGNNQQVISFATNKDLRVDALVTLARTSIALGQYDDARQFLDSVSDDPDVIATGDFSALQRNAKVLFEQAEIANAESRYTDFLRRVEGLREIYLLIRDHATEASSSDTTDPAFDALTPMQEGTATEASASGTYNLAFDTLTPEQKERARSVLERFIRAQSKAVADTHNDLQSKSRGIADLGALVAELDEAFGLYATLVPEEASVHRWLKAYLAESKADYYLTALDDKEQSFALADESLGLAAGLLNEDPENLRYRRLLVDALVQRAQVLSQIDDINAAKADLSLARQVVFDTKLKRPPTLGWRRLDNAVSFYEFRVHDRTGSPEKGKLGAARLKSELDFTAGIRNSDPRLLRDYSVFAIWALIDSKAASALPDEDQVRYYEYMLDQSSEPLPDPEDDYVRRRMRSWSFARLLTLPVESVGEDTWLNWYQQALDNASVTKSDPKKTMFEMAALRYVPMPLMQYVEPGHALLAKSTIDSLQGLDSKKDTVLALPLFRAAMEGIPMPDAEGEKMLAYTRLQNTVSANFFNFDTTAETAPEWLTLLDSAIAVNEALENGDDDTHILYCWLVGQRAGWFRDSGNTERATKEYAYALDVCLDPPGDINLSRSTLRNAMFNTGELMKLTKSGARIPDAAAASIHRLINEILPAHKSEPILLESRSYLQTLQRNVSNLDGTGVPFNRARIDGYKTVLRDLLKSTDPDGIGRGAESDGGEIVAGTAAGTAGEQDSETRLLGNGPLETDFQKIFSRKQLRESEHVNWTHNPLYAGSWRTVFGSERDGLLERLLGSERDSAQYVRMASLPFYDEGKLVEVELAVGEGSIGVYTLLVFPDHAYALNGTSPPIHEANAKAPVRLNTADQVSAYLRFFMTYVNGKGGAFLIVDSGDEIDWLSSAEAELRESVVRKIRPLAVWPDESKDGHWKATATLQYSSAIFSAILAVQPTGMIVMEDDQPVAANLPVNPVVISERRFGEGKYGATPWSTERHRFKAENFGFVSAPDFRGEIRAIDDALEVRGAEALDHVLSEYVHLLQDEVLLSALSSPAGYINSLAYTMLSHEIRLDDAMSLAASAHERDPDEPTIKDTYGWALVKTGQLDEGIDALLEAEALFAEKPGSDKIMLELYAHLGHAYRLNGQTELAREALEKALRYDVPGQWLDLAAADLALLGETPARAVGTE